MFRFIIMRVGGLVGVLLAVSLLTFFLMQSVPGGPFDAMGVATAQMIPQEIVENLEKLYGLDKPLWTQYWLFLKAALRGDFGYSFYASGRSVNELIREHWPYSIQVGLMTLAFSSVVGLGPGHLFGNEPRTLARLLGHRGLALLYDSALLCLCQADAVCLGRQAWLAADLGLGGPQVLDHARAGQLAGTDPDPAALHPLCHLRRDAGQLRAHRARQGTERTQRSPSSTFSRTR